MLRIIVKGAFLIATVLISAFTQGQTLEGRITDSSGIPIEGVYILHLASEHHAHSDQTGNFILPGVARGDSIQTIHVGYEVTNILIDKPTERLDIILTEKIFQLDEIIVGNSIKSLNSLATIDLETNPVNSSQQVLRKVPGLFIGQHAGGGKAEQIFLRGFDIDHGTDINITVDGLPVNMVSHAHGQGYADLHFVIPETIEKIDFDKGPYNPTKGNFATAGYVDFKTKDRLENNLLRFESGRFGTIRTVGLFDLVSQENRNAYLATEYLVTDGPFQSSQNLNRLNIMGKFKAQLKNRDGLSVLLSHFRSKWDASGQIPTRAVRQGLIGRFGAIDDTEGGNTGRTNVSLDYVKFINERTFVKNLVYLSNYDFELYSNFTFFLNDPLNGDQIRQKEKRTIFGFQSEINNSITTTTGELSIQAGAGFRYDDINNNELSRTIARRATIENLRLGDVDETNFFTYLSTEWEFGNWLLNAALRLDYFKYNYVNSLDSVFSTQSVSKPTFSPKLNVLYNINRDVQLFVKSGVGYHSNDARVISEQMDKQDILPSAYGLDVGTIWKPMPRLILNTALWYLFLEQEFVYVGDEGIVEPSGRSRRHGLDFNLRYQILDWLFIDSDLNYAIPRSIDAPEGQRFIPLAPSFTTVNGLSIRTGKFNGGIRSRYLMDRPANDDNTIEAQGYFIIDINGNYQWKNFTLGTRIENLFNSKWKETQFATESRLRSETSSVDEIHFTPGTPFFINFNVQYKY